MVTEESVRPSPGSSKLPSAELVDHIRGTLGLLQRRLATAPDLQLLVKSVGLSQARLGERVVAYEGLLPRLRSVVARQRTELTSSATLLQQARQAYLETQYRLKLRQLGSTSGSGGGGARENAQTTSVAVQTDGDDGGNASESQMAKAAHGGEGGRGTPTSATVAAAAEATLALPAAQAEAASLRQQLQSAREQMRLAEDVSRRRAGQLDLWRRRAQFQAGVNDKLQHVIETQNKLLGCRSGADPAAGRRNDRRDPDVFTRTDGAPDTRAAGAGEYSARHDDARAGGRTRRDGSDGSSNTGDEEAEINESGGEDSAGSGGFLEDIEEATEEEDDDGDDADGRDDVDGRPDRSVTTARPPALLSSLTAGSRSVTSGAWPPRSPPHARSSYSGGSDRDRGRRSAVEAQEKEGVDDDEVHDDDPYSLAACR